MDRQRKRDVFTETFFFLYAEREQAGPSRFPLCDERVRAIGLFNSYRFSRHRNLFLKDQVHQKQTQIPIERHVCVRVHALAGL